MYTLRKWIDWLYVWHARRYMSDIYRWYERFYPGKSIAPGNIASSAAIYDSSVDAMSLTSNESIGVLSGKYQTCSEDPICLILKPRRNDEQKWGHVSKNHVRVWWWSNFNLNSNASQLCCQHSTPQIQTRPSRRFLHQICRKNVEMERGRG